MMNFSQPIFWLSLVIGSLGAGSQMELKGNSPAMAKQESQQIQTSESSTSDIPVMRCEPFPECTIWPTSGGTDGGDSSGGN